MARKRRLQAKALNIRLNEHNRATYSAYIKAIRKRKLPVNVWGDTYVAIVSVEALDTGNFRGIIAKFTDIDSDAWFDGRQFEEYDHGPEIPSNWYANYRPFHFYFDTQNHTFYFESYGIEGPFSETFVLKYFQKLLKDPILLDEFGHGDVNVIQDKEKLEEIFGIAELKKVQITIKRPNQDMWPEARSRQIQDRFRRMRVKEEMTEYKSVANQSIEPDEEMMEDAAVAMRDGKVRTEGHTRDGAKDVRGSEAHPAQEGVRYDPDEQTDLQAFRDAITKLHGRIMDGEN
ncbi:DUF4747 family protein [Euryhalocaulis caribicus]|uniref:DUF4747 family protein n=1 Tax=Euryhalocaulis caribicus TaxID=1161401 RepID=UPI0009DBC172|nr:DUF4747 family protein [Euryhalocaulis caribicus]